MTSRNAEGARIERRLGRPILARLHAAASAGMAAGAILGSLIVASQTPWAGIAAQASFAASVAGFALIGFGTGALVPCGFALAARQTAARPAVGLSSASLFSTLTRLPAPLATGAIAQSLSLPLAFAAFAVALAAASTAMAALGPSGGGARAAKNV